VVGCRRGRGRRGSRRCVVIALDTVLPASIWIMVGGTLAIFPELITGRRGRTECRTRRRRPIASRSSSGLRGGGRLPGIATPSDESLRRLRGSPASATPQRAARALTNVPAAHRFAHNILGIAGVITGTSNTGYFTRTDQGTLLSAATSTALSSTTSVSASTTPGLDGGPNLTH